MNKTKITLLTGYLGSGKTTLINHILKNQEGYKIAVIVNDVGEINIDSELIEKSGYIESNDSLVSLSNGCICCNLKEDLIFQIIDICKYDFSSICFKYSNITEISNIVKIIDFPFILTFCLHYFCYCCLYVMNCIIDVFIITRFKWYISTYVLLFK